jgi:hypothetical protein
MFSLPFDRSEPDGGLSLKAHDLPVTLSSVFSLPTLVLKGRLKCYPTFLLAFRSSESPMPLLSRSGKPSPL